MHDRYGFDTRVAVGEFFERVAQAVYGGYSPRKHAVVYGINIDPDLTNGGWWREVKAQRTAERLHLRHLQMWRYLTLMSIRPNKRFHYVICRYQMTGSLKKYRKDREGLQAALAKSLKTIIQLPFSAIFRVTMLPEDQDRIYRPPGQFIDQGTNRFYMTTWWQCGRVRELVDQGIPAFKRMGIPWEQYTEHRFGCRLQGTEDFEIIHIKEKRPVQAQRDLLAEYDEQLSYFIDLENGHYDRDGETDWAFAGDFEQEQKEQAPELGLKLQTDIPF
jgi:hypothetical protein